VLTLSGGTSAQGWQASAMAYSARWTATDQVPQRLIDAGARRPALRPLRCAGPSTGGDSRRSSLSGLARRRQAGTHPRVGLRDALPTWT
jgi:hypothetical protein